MGGTGTVTYTVSNGDVKAAANADVYVEDGALSANATKDVTYFEQKMGLLPTAPVVPSMKQLDGKLTTEATTASSSTADPESSGRSHQLHRQIPLLPRCGSKPSGFRGHQPEQHHYQPV